MTATNAQLKRWRQYLANERAEGAVYRELANRRSGEERAILLALAEAERRHEDHWIELLADQAGKPVPADVRTRILGVLAKRFGSVFVLALAQSAESRSPYEKDLDATPQMAADEQIHEEVVRALAARGRTRLSGTFRAAVFGANDGLVSNLSLVVGMSATGIGPTAVLLSGIAGLLAGALSMGAGEYVSVLSQRELLEASSPNPDASKVLPSLDVDHNELTLVYRARGMSEADAAVHAAEVMARLDNNPVEQPLEPAMRTGAVATSGEHGDHEEIGSAFGAAVSSFLFFSSGAIIPVLPMLFGLSGLSAVVVSTVLVGIALLATGAIVGVLSGAPPLRRALRQLAIGLGAAAVTYLLGLAFGTTIG